MKKLEHYCFVCGVKIEKKDVYRIKLFRFSKYNQFNTVPNTTIDLCRYHYKWMIHNVNKKKEKLENERRES